MLPLAAWQPVAAAQTPEQPSAAAPPAHQVATHWKTNLPGNVQVQLEGVTGLLSDSRVGHWHPDGSDLRLDPQELLPSYPFKPGERYFAVKITVPDAQRILHTYVAFRIEGADFNQVTSASSVMQDGRLQNYGIAGVSAMFPASQEKATLLFQIAADPLKMVLSGSPLQATTKRLDRGDIAILSRVALGRARSMGKNIAVYTVQLTLPSRLVRESDYTLIYINRNGAPRNFKYSSANIPDTSGEQTTIRYTWRQSEVPLSALRELRFLSRPFRTVVFPNVAVQPRPQER